MSTSSVEDRSAWQWMMLILQSPHATPELVADAGDGRTGEGPSRDRPGAARAVRPGPRGAGAPPGPYGAEGPTTEALHRFEAEQGLALRGKHHEIYLGDPRRSAPEKLRTIIRQPVGPA